MASFTIFFFFIPLITGILLTVNFMFSISRPYHEKNSTFECGYHSFVGQNRTQFNISFFIFGLLFLLFDLEITILYPYTVSAYTNGLYGLMIVIVFIIILTFGFIYEFGKNALKISSKQDIYINKFKNSTCLIQKKSPLSLFIKRIAKPKNFITAFIIYVTAFFSRGWVNQLTNTNVFKEPWTITSFIYYLVLAVYSVFIRSAVNRFNGAEFKAVWQSPCKVGKKISDCVKLILYDKGGSGKASLKPKSFTNSPFVNKMGEIRDDRPSGPGLNPETGQSVNVDSQANTRRPTRKIGILRKPRHFYDNRIIKVNKNSPLDKTLASSVEPEMVNPEKTKKSD